MVDQFELTDFDTTFILADGSKLVMAGVKTSWYEHNITIVIWSFASTTIIFFVTER